MQIWISKSKKDFLNCLLPQKLEVCIFCITFIQYQLDRQSLTALRDGPQTETGVAWVACDEGAWVWAYSSASRWSRNHPMVETALDSWELLCESIASAALRNLENSAVFYNFKERNSTYLAPPTKQLITSWESAQAVTVPCTVYATAAACQWLVRLRVSSSGPVVQRNFFFKSWNLCGFHDPKSDQRIRPEPQNTKSCC